MAYEQILYQVEGGVCRITMNRPEAMNAITPAMLKELKAAVQAAGKAPEVRRGPQGAGRGDADRR